MGYNIDVNTETQANIVINIPIKQVNNVSVIPEIQGNNGL